MNASELKPGIIVRGPVLPEPVEVLIVTPLGDVIKIVGAGQKTGQVHQRVLRLDQIQFLDATPEREPFDGDPARFRLGVEAARLGLAYEYDPYFSLSISIHLMQMIGWLMIALFVWLFHGPWLAFKRAVDVEDWPSASATLNRIRQIIAVNLPLGLLVVVIGGSGRYWG